MNTTNTQDPLEQKIDYLTRKVVALAEQVQALRDPAVKFTFTVEELAARWSLSAEAVRRLVRDKQLRPLREFRPFRFTLKEVRDFEDSDAPRLRGLESRRKGGRR